MKCVHKEEVDSFVTECLYLYRCHLRELEIILDYIQNGVVQWLL